MLWWNWQRINSKHEQFNGKRDGRRVKTSDMLIPFHVNVTSVLNTNTAEHCYTYPRYELFEPNDPPFKRPEAGRRNGLLRSMSVGDSDPASVPNPKPLPISFIAMSNMDLEKVRTIEQEFRELNV
ncbi:hypothetical protein DSO57_1006306 [Entomophthora muscae]|uniref:Uncharacterized protein n=1 Tax=Entomophthora muscae TaxID=34485 RepID=A0ACC2T7S4_9FUNG|nr:hypothetical protein DSO57_1006306 [Entomophthora muscae]